jgi:beta-galactosidase
MEPDRTGDSFVVPAVWENLQIRLRFEGVDSAFHVWVTGQEIGYSQASRNASEFDITSALKPQPSSNTIAVRVYEFCDGSYLERQDQWLLSGIFRDVYLIAFPTCSIIDFTSTPVVRDTFRNSVLKTSVTTQGTARLPMTVKLLTADGLLVGQESVQQSGAIVICVPESQLMLWPAEAPYI